MSGIAGDPNNPSRLVVTGSVYNNYANLNDPKYIGIYLTANGGDTWTTVKVANETKYLIGTAAFDPSNSNVLYAWGRKADYQSGIIYRSANGGASWTALPSSFAEVKSLAVDTANSKIVYAGTAWSGVFRSTNSGQTWTKCTGPGGAYSIIVNKNNPKEVFAGEYHGVFYSKDRGLTWTDISEGLVIKQITHLEFHAASKTLFAGTYGGGIWKKKL